MSATHSHPAPPPPRKPFMPRHSRLSSTAAVALLLHVFSIASVVHAAAPEQPPTATLERWRSYSGVTWEAPATSRADAAPAPSPHSVSAPIAGIHFDGQGQAFVSTPRLVSAQAPATLSRLDTRITSGPARLTAFPSISANAVQAAPQQALRNVLGFYVDQRNGWLWALDMGFVAGEAQAPEGAQKVLVIDLASGQTVRRIALDGVADRSGSFLNDIVVDEARRVAYISDSGLRSAPQNQAALIVVDFASGQARRVLHRHPALLPEPGVQVFSHGEEVWPGNPLQLGINGIALSPDRATLYWTVTTGRHAYAIPTAVLHDTAATDAQRAAQIQNLGDVGGNTDGIATDAQGLLYITDVTRNGIVRYNPHRRSMSLLAADDGIRWPDTATFTPGGDLLFTASNLNQHFAGAVQPGQERYELWRLKLSPHR